MDVSIYQAVGKLAECLRIHLPSVLTVRLQFCHDPARRHRQYLALSQESSYHVKLKTQATTRVLILARYGPLAASMRYRFLQYLPILEQQGFTFTVDTLFDDRYLRRLYAGKPVDKVRVIRSYTRRMQALLRSRSFDLIWVHFDPFPWAPGRWDTALLPRHIPYVVDLDDAMFHRYDKHPSQVVRRVLKTKFDRLMSDAAAVVAGNEYIANRAVQVGAQDVVVIPTVVDLERYRLKRDTDLTDLPLTIGWIGSPSTAYNVQIMRSALERMSESQPVRLVTVGSGEIDLGSRLDHIVRPWSESTEIDEIHGFDVGTMPLVDSPFERGKSGFKLIQCMACGLPVVASPVGVNVDLVEHGTNGFLADSQEAWYTAMMSLANDPVLRREMGLAGRRLVEAAYSLQVAAPRLEAVLRRASDRPAR